VQVPVKTKQEAIAARMTKQKNSAKKAVAPEPQQNFWEDVPPRQHA
jgi:hypothetical protein